MMMPGDAEAVKGRKLQGRSLRRAWRFARPYRRTIIVFLSAIVLAAALRAEGIACRLHFADVRNHLTTARLKELMQTDTFYYHGYNDIFLDNRWIKVTPAFNLSLCEKFRVKPLEWDGTHDAVFQPFDLEGRRHMEYITDHGSFADVPFDAIINTFATCYGNKSELYAEHLRRTGDFAQEGDEEAQKEKS